jgi:hypothetical protein
MTIINPTEIVIVNDYIPSSKRPDVHYIGMNYWAAQELGVEWPYTKNTAVVTNPILFLGRYNPWGINEVLLHEQTEAKLMQEGLPYDKAHAETLKLVGWGAKR